MMNYIVTGASSGIGFELSRLLCHEYGNEIRVIGVGRSKERLEKLEKEFTRCFKYIVADLSSLQGIDNVVKEVRNRLDRVDVLINNAGFGLYKQIIDHSDEELITMTLTNFIAPLILTKKLLNLMRKGSIVVMVITAGIHVLMKNLPIYGATKIALHYATEALRYELERYGIHLLAVYPGAVKSEFHSRAGRDIKRGIEVVNVAKAVVKAIKKKKKRLYIPNYLSIARLFGPYLPALY
ncbi:MAG: SDR family NAD(P)-dependent oxidoreductase [Ignisphaera sp.]